jgi:hypothetical protein
VLFDNYSNLVANWWFRHQLLVRSV